MVVTTTTSAGGGYIVYSGTIQEVIDAVEANQSPSRVMSGPMWNGTNFSAVIRNR